MKRIYTDVVRRHLASYSQMCFISGPRQVGKTTIAKESAAGDLVEYLNWDNTVDRAQILSLFERKIDPKLSAHLLTNERALILDEVHKFKNWKNYVKGLYDTYKDAYKIILTGSARLNVYRKGGDSLMGRYFNYTIHPLTVGEIARPIFTQTDIQPPVKIEQALYDNLFRFGGYPEPFLKQEQAFHQMWQNSRFQQLFREEIRDVEDIKSLGQLELLAQILQNQAGGAINYTTLAKMVQVTLNTVKKWIQLLESFYFCFTIKPWSKNMTRALIRESKVYLCDWSVVTDPGMRFENFIASHLIKSITLWNETGLGKYDIFYIRTKEQQEVDFLITKNNAPWILVEAKYSNNNSISKNLFYFQEKTKAPFAFQVVHNLEYVDKSCFEHEGPIIVPASTFLSQFV